MTKVKKQSKPIYDIYDLEEKEFMRELLKRKREFSRELVKHKDNLGNWLESKYEKTRSEFPCLPVPRRSATV